MTRKNWERKIIRFVKNDDKKVIFLINLKDNPNKISNYIKEYLGHKSSAYLLVFFNSEIPSQFANTNLNIKTSEDYLSKEDYEKIDKYVFEDISKSWYLYGGITDYHSISLGMIFEYDFQKYLTPRLKNLEIIQKIIAKENIEKIIVIEDTDELKEVARLYSDMVNIPILEISFKKRALPISLSLKVKSKLATLFSMLLDYIAFRRIAKLKDNKDLILIDAKLYRFLQNMDNEISFLQCPLEKGIGIRLYLIKKGFAYLPLYFIENRRYLNDWIGYKKRWSNLYFKKDFRDLFKYNGILLWEIVCKQLSNFFLESIPRIISNINMLVELGKREKIKLIILRNDVKELERTIILGLRLTKIPSLVIQHGILAESNGHNVLLADKFAAWGKASVDWYAKFNNPSEKFEVTGNPYFDMLKDWRPQLSRQEIFRRLNLDKNKGIILLATQQINKFSSFWTDDLFWVMVEKVLKVLKYFPDKQLIIKVDPYEDMAHYRDRILLSSSNNSIAIRNIDISTLLYLSELVITQDSTVGLEGIIFDKPLITINLTKREDRVPYAKKQAAIGVYKEEDLTKAIQMVLFDPAVILQLKLGRKKFLEEYVYRMDGRTTERIANIFRYYVKNEKESSI